MSHLRQCLKQDSENHQAKNQVDPQMKILVVEDDPVASELLEDDLNAVGWEVQSVSTGEGARELIEGSHFDVVVTDVRLPGMSGIDALAEIRKIAERLPVLLITAYADLRQAVAAVKCGAADYLAKPVDLDE